LPSEKTNEQTRREWQDLGLQYSRNDKSRLWILEGSPEGLVAFASLVRTFAGALASDPALDHAHYGPHMYLERMRSERPGVTDRCIRSAAPSLLRLAATVERSAGGVWAGRECKYRIRGRSFLSLPVASSLRDSRHRSGIP